MSFKNHIKNFADTNSVDHLPFYIPWNHYTMFKQASKLTDLLKDNEKNNFLSPSQIQQVKQMIDMALALYRTEYFDKTLENRHKEFMATAKELGLNTDITLAQKENK